LHFFYLQIRAPVRLWRELADSQDYLSGLNFLETKLTMMLVKIPITAPARISEGQWMPAETRARPMDKAARKKIIPQILR